MSNRIKEGTTYLLPNGEKVLAEFCKIPQSEWDHLASKTLAGSNCPACGESFEEDEGLWRLLRLGPISDTHAPTWEERPEGLYVGDPTPRCYIVDKRGGDLQLLPEGAPDHLCDICGTERYEPKKFHTPYTVDDLVKAAP